MTESDNRPDCFGVLDFVFPLAEDGLRQSPEVCMACDHKTACLKEAIARGEGLKVEDEKVDRAYQSGKMTFFERWARKKSIHQRKQKGKAQGR
ncbi:MAG: hypothetical protein KGY38_01665 [Desulfobacterales bacterium]|nr:hypothetical protein [Desulfobacterales bacterium]